MTESKRVGYHGSELPWVLSLGDPDWAIPLSDAPDIPGLRRVVSECLGPGASADLLADARLIVTELAANALAHGGGDVIARGWKQDLGLVLAITDAGRGSARRIWVNPSKDNRAPGGRGLILVLALAAQVDVVALPQGTTVFAIVR